MTASNVDVFEQWRKSASNRFADNFVDARLAHEQRKADGLINPKYKHKFFKVEKRQLIYYGLKLSGLYNMGKRNAAAIRFQHNQLMIKNLPSAFVGYRILHISDPHFNGDQQTLSNLKDTVSSVDYDLCVFTGDYRYRSFGPIDIAMASLKELMSVVSGQAIGILGNHDSLRMVPYMESMGISVLLNEHCTIAKNHQHFNILGVDDPSYYRSHDLQRTIDSIGNRNNDCSILLAHSPDLYQQAVEFGIAAYLCGHTHGGQICLPGGTPIRRNVNTPDWTIAGNWHYQNMCGYTSVGVGTSIAEVRFFCPPEITVHELICA